MSQTVEMLNDYPARDTYITSRDFVEPATTGWIQFRDLGVEVSVLKGRDDQVIIGCRKMAE